MPTFRFKAFDQKGQSVQDTLVADNQHAALLMLGDRGLFPIEVQEGGQSQTRALIGGKKKVKLRLLSSFYGQLADLLKAGVPVLRSLDILAKQSSNLTLAEIVREIREGVAGGSSLADALAKHPHVFRELHVAMVRAGERGGFLEDALARISQFVERQDELRNKLVGSMIYPAILTFIGGSIILFLLTIVVPELRPFFEQIKQNVLTKLVFAICDFLRVYGWGLVLVAAGMFSGAAFYVRSEAGHRQYDLWKLKTPVLGKILVMIALCRFCRILGTMLASGVPILQALRISRDSVGNEILAVEVDRAAENVQKGGLISQPFASSSLFPLDIVDMIAVAEESNNLESILVQIADTNEARTARMIDFGVRLVEPILLTVLASIIAIIALALLVPILTMSSNMAR